MQEIENIQLSELLLPFARLEAKYDSWLSTTAMMAVELYEPGEKRQDYIDYALNNCSVLEMPYLLGILFYAKGRVVVPVYHEELDGPWSQLLYGIARGTVERDLKDLIADYAVVPEPLT